MSVGPRKIVLIQSGKYDYGEVDLSGAVQIVGPNNTGKTTLINTLQFLYIDDLRRMDFGSYTPEQTREYYFPNQYSYILFECLGSRGDCVVGWRGQSKASGGDAERFCYQGRYDGADFLDEKNQVREPRDVAARLALKEFRIIKSAQDHRELLLPPSSQQDRGLGIVMLRDGDKYHHFREILKNLLVLSSITQTEMRDRLLMLAEIPPDRVALDARDLFGQDYDRIRERREQLRRFKAQQSTVELLVSKFAEREGIRGEMVYRWQDLRGRQQVFEKDHSSAMTKLRETVLEEKRKQNVLSSEIEDRRKEIGIFRERKGGLDVQLNELEKAKREFENFIEELERAAAVQLSQRIKNVEQQLAQAETETAERARQKTAFHRELVQQKERTIARFDKVVVTELRKHFRDEEIEALFRLLNRDLLEYPAGPEGVEVLRLDELRQALVRTLQRITGLSYRDENVAVRFANTPGTMAAVPDLESVKSELSEQRNELQRWEKILAAIEQREALARERTALEQERELKQRRLFQFEEFQKRKAEEPRILQELKVIKASIAAASERVDDLELKFRTAETAERNASGAIVSAENEFNAVMGRFNQCRTPEFANPVTPAESIPNDFDAAISLYLRQQEREERLTADVESILRQVEAHFADRFTGIEQRETVANLQAELEAMPEKEEALARDWNAHIHGLKATFERVLKELRHVQSAADDLNRQLSKIAVSNLKQLRMEVIEQGDIVNWLRKLSAMEQPGLFDDDTRLEPVLKNFRQKLEASPITRFADLFSLGFTVVGADDRKHTYHDFRQIESHGTTITIKVLFNLLVLKSQLRKDACHVPFFLDEIQALDPANRQAILQTAQKLGFVAITAAPDSVSEVNYLYFLQPRNGRIVLRNKHRIGVKQNPAA